MRTKGEDIGLEVASLCNDQARAVWQERVLGADIYEIAAKLNTSAQEVLDLLCQHHKERQAQPTEAKSFYRDLALSRCEKLLSVYLPIGLLKEVTLERIRCGQVVAEEDVNYSLHAAAFTLALLKFEAELLGLKDTSSKPNGTGQEDISSWLRAQVEFINKMVREAPRDTLSLPTDGLKAEPKTPEEPRRVCDTLPVEEFEMDLQSDQIDVAPAAGAANILAPDVAQHIISLCLRRLHIHCVFLFPFVGRWLALIERCFNSLRLTKCVVHSFTAFPGWK